MSSRWCILLGPLLAAALVVMGITRVGGSVLVLPHTHADHAHADHGHDHWEGERHAECAGLLVRTPGGGHSPCTPPHVHLSDADGIAPKAGSEEAPAGADEPGIETPAFAAPVDLGVLRACRNDPARPTQHALDRLRTVRLQV